MPARWIRPACLVLLAAAWALDLLTPQLLVVSILLNGPIALSSLTLDPRFTRLLVVLALAANAAAGYVNGLSEGGHWDAIAIGDRIISGFSFLLVGGLSIATERAAHEAGQSAARQERTLRERDVQRSIEVIRASVNVEVIERAIAREACAALHVDEAIFYEIDVNSDRPATYCSVPGSDVDATLERPPPAVLSLVQRVAEDAQLRELGRGDALGRLLLDTYDAPQGFVIPLVEHETVYGVLVLLRRSTPFEPHFEEGVRRYAEQAAIALARARLFVEISERNEELATANAALRERTEVIRDIVYALSHDLRTPLSAARMTMEQALAGAYGDLPQTYRALLERALQSNEELQRLAETLLLVARYESGEQSTGREPVALALVATDVLAELEPLWKVKPLRVELDLQSEPTVAGDSGELRRALVNLLSNAVAFTPAGGTVRVRVGVDGEQACVVVEDDGFGVPEEERARLFQRLTKAAARPGAGSGLGLYVVRRIAESHGGSIAYAPAAGGGSKFTLTLPLVRATVAI